MSEQRTIPEPLPPGSAPTQAKAWVRRLVRLMGAGFHPDTPFDEYRTPDGARSFTPSECALLEQGLATAWDILDRAGIEIYAVAEPVQRRVLLGH